jgi:hypothetical protein
MVPEQGPGGEMFYFQTQWFIHSFIHIPQISQSVSTSTEQWENMSPSTETHVG